MIVFTFFLTANQMAPQVLHRVIFGTINPTTAQISNLTIVPALLPHYMRHRVSDCDYPAIILSSEPDASVRGTYVHGLTAEDQWRLDLFEGDQYDRIKVRTKLLDQEGKEITEAEAETYVWKDADIGLEEGEWDFEEFRKEKMSRWIGEDDEYEGELRLSILGTLRSHIMPGWSLLFLAEVDEAVEKAKDPTGGRGLNGHITERLEASCTSEREILEAAV